MVGLEPPSGAGAVDYASESDFSPRKIRASFVCLVGITFGTTYPVVMSLTFLMLPMTQEFGWSRTQFSLAMTCLMGASTVAMPVFGRIADRLGVRPMLMFSAAAVGCVSLMMAVQNGTLFMFYAGYALFGVLGGGGLLYGKVVAALFTRHRGKALAIFGAESTLALAVLPPITLLLMSQFGWRGVYFGFAVLIFAVIPFIYFLVEEPGQIGGLPRLGARLKAAPAAAPPVMEGMTTGQVLRDPNFWLLIIATLLGMAFVGGITTHLVPALIDKGFSQATAVGAVSAITLVGLAGALAGGFLVDRFQTPKIAAPFKLVAALAMLLLLVASPGVGGLALLFTAIALKGGTTQAHQPMSTYFQTRFFGMRAFNEIKAIQTSCIAVCMALAPPLIGVIYDRTGSYDAAFILAAGGSLAGAVLILFLGPYRYAVNVGLAQDEPAAHGAPSPSSAGPANPTAAE